MRWTLVGASTIAAGHMVGAFRAAGQGTPAATGEDGIASLAVSLAVREAARTGQSRHVKVPA